MPIIGLTGGMGSGKTTVSNILKGMGAEIIDADQISRDIQKPNKDAYNEIVEFFGTDILNDNKEINREKLGAIVFANNAKLEKLNDITHNKIIEEIENKIETNTNQNKDFIVIDAPLLIEAQMMDIVDKIWLVVVDEEEQIKRIIARDNCDAEVAKVKMKTQMPLEEKKKYADVIINNNKDVKHLELFLSGLIRREISE